MAGREISAQAIAETREAVREQNRLRALPLEDVVARARAAAVKRQTAPGGSGKMAVPLGLQAALAADERVYREPKPRGEIVAPEVKTPERVGRRGKTSPLGTLVRGMVLPGAKPKERSADVYAAGSNYIDRQHPEF